MKLPFRKSKVLVSIRNPDTGLLESVSGLGERTQATAEVGNACPAEGASSAGQPSKGSESGGGQGSITSPNPPAPLEKTDSLPDADSPEYAAWAAQRNETGRLVKP